MVDNNYNNTNTTNANNSKSIKYSKSYVTKSFVVDTDVLIKLKKVAVEQDRTLNWLVRQILKDYSARV